MPTIRSRSARITFVLLITFAAGTARAQYVQTNIVSDISGMAPLTDPNLKNPWGISFTSGSPFWVSDEATVRPNTFIPGTNSQVASLYVVNATSNPSVNALVVPILNLPIGNPAPPDPVTQTNGPTGQVTPGAPGIVNANPTTDFQIGASQANFIFANLDGSISAWRGGLNPSQAVIEASVAGAAFSGLGIANAPAGLQLYAADQNSPNINVFNGAWTKTGSITDPNLPPGYTAFNVQNIGGNLYITFVNQANALGGIVDVFNPTTGMLSRLITDTAGVHLDQPWGLALAPSNFGAFSGDLLVGNNNGDGRINAYNPTSGAFAGFLTLPSGQPFSEGDLWALTFGSGGGNGGFSNTLYFTAGLSSQVDGLFGAITAIPEPSSLVLSLLAAAICAPLVFGLRRRRLAPRG